MEFGFSSLILLFCTINIQKLNNTMESSILNEALKNLLEKRTQLSQLPYSDASYDDVEEELHDMEDDFNESHGSLLEKALNKVHREYCSESDVLLATSYMPKAVSYDEANQPVFDVNEGVLVEMDDLKALEARIVLIPNPTRILLLTPGETLEVWTEA
jgi:hypothetical protein